MSGARGVPRGDGRGPVGERPDPAPALDGVSPHALRDYSFLGDGYRGALMGPHGDVAWLCAPHWDSEPVFSTLLGGPGSYVVTPADTHVWGGYYEPGTLIWRARWVTRSTQVECREALAMPSDSHRLVLLRRIEAIERDVAVDVLLRLGAGFDEGGVPLHAVQDDVWAAEGCGLRARWSGAFGAHLRDDGAATVRLRLAAGESIDLVLEISDRPLDDAPLGAAGLWTSTEAYWRGAVPAFREAAGSRDARHSYAVVRGLTAPGGGMVAAATMGLPERAESGRNYDYRYVWLRDQAYAGVAAAVHGPDVLTDEAVRFSTARLLQYGPRVPPAFDLDGGLPPEEHDSDLPGYPGGRVVVGNWVRDQFQLDACGELLQLYATSGRDDRLQSDDIRAVSTVLTGIKRFWREPDAGIWELEPAWWTHSRLTCVAGLRSIAPVLAPSDRVRCVDLAETILAETSRRCLNPDGSWRQTAEDGRVDASLLLPPVRGALSPHDPRSVATLQAVMRDLVEDGYVYRYAVDDRPLGEAEGAFQMCGFVVSLAELAVGHELTAFRWFERQRAAVGPPGLLTEEFDVGQRQERGNLPQGFVHALLLETSLRLGESGHGQWAG